MKSVVSHPLRLADLPNRRPTAFRLVPEGAELAALAERLGVDAIRKVRLEGTLAPGPGRDWTLDAQLGATVVQPCRVTTEPVVTRIEERIARRYAADWQEPGEGETETPDEDVEPVPAVLDLGLVLEEEIALGVPDFPRAPEADALDLEARPAGAEPIEAERRRPFAGLADLRRRMDGEEE
ncbi:DUF177 domain-containing protein [Jannaschia sp. W003]|uniref:YceD family protein n=1 Tax=Jannaschia sp. W003 TaxID=2867012 RepID=UPI0021A2687D|nr:DUF177 domain-containing protein [Jannaschia sp. W003]UWQ20706.1 DUF177 domain-containing protein [Jannaschia sp. W003]